MSRRNDKAFLRDIQEAVQRIGEYTAEIEYREFLDDRKTQDAVIRNLEIIGEAVKHLSAEVRVAHSAIPWKEMAGVRDRLIHDYFGVNLDIVWQIVTGELPDVGKQISSVIEQT
jgi:uncharacterized protein with HEPN domain